MLHFIVELTLRMLWSHFERLQEKTVEEPLRSGRHLPKNIAEGPNNMEQRNKKFTPSRKLLPSQCNKEHYVVLCINVVHFAILKFYLEMGLQLRHVHRVAKYRKRHAVHSLNPVKFCSHKV